MVNLVFVNYFLINTLDLSGYIVPLDAVHLIVSATSCKLRDTPASASSGASGTAVCWKTRAVSISARKHGSFRN